MLSRTSLRLFLLPIGILLAVAGQWVLTPNQNTVAGLLLYLGAIVLVLLGLPQTGTAVFPFQPPCQVALRNTLVRAIALAALLIACLLSFTLNTKSDFTVAGGVEYQFTLAGVVAWFASILLFLIVFWEPERSRAEWWTRLRAKAEGWRSGFTLSVNWTMVAMAAVLVVGAFFYFYRINAVPVEMTSDHAEKLLDINDILGGHYPVFFPRNTGREPFQFYVTTAIIKLTGIPLSHLALKLGTALIGFLAISATFLLARAMYGDLVGVLAAFFVAVSRWPLAIARMGLRYPYTPFFTALSLYFVWRALQYQKRNDYLMAGLLLGAGLYGYIPSRDAPLVALGFIILWLLVAGRRYLHSLRPLAVNAGLMYGMLLVVFLPLLRYSLDFPEMFWYRALTRVSSAEQAVRGSIPVIFAQNVWNLALMFNWRGDSVWVTTIPGQPAMDLVSGALLILGVAIALYQLVRRRELRHLFLLAGFAALLLPSALSFAFPNENPSLVRTGGAIPFAAILLALPLAALVRQVRLVIGNWGRGLRVALLGIILFAVAGLNYRWYFFEYANNYRMQAMNSAEVAAVIHGFATSVGDLQHAYFVGYPYWLDGRTIAIDLGDIHWDQYTLDVSELHTDNSANQLFVLNPEDKLNLAKLRALYPNGRLSLDRSATPGKDFYSYFVPARARGN